MPDTIQFLDERAISILDAAKRAFAEKGFDGASMQDLARAAQMSAGNFYRYFPSKNAIVAAMIARDLADVQQDFRLVQSSADPARALIDVMCRRIDALECTDGPLWAEIDAAAARNREIAEVVRGMEAQITAFLAAVFANISGLTFDEAGRRFGGHAQFLILLFKGASLRLAGRGCQMADGTRMQLRDLILKTIDHTLAEVAAARPATPEKRVGP